MTRQRQRHHLILLILLIHRISFSIADDGAIMTKLSNSISPTPSSWKPNTNYCDWEGISCDTSNRVTSIKFPIWSLNNGTLPSDLNKLSKLTTLDLSYNSFSGPVPTLANLTLLQEAYLDGNEFNSIPVDLFLGLTSLQNFSISQNQNLEPWFLPNDLTKCTSLRTFGARSVNLKGTIPSELNNLSLLNTLILQDNLLSGRIPILSNLTLLEQVILDSNRFTSIPIDFFFGLTNLRIFRIGRNLDLEPWSLPNDIMQCNNLNTINAGNANIMGSFPDFLTGLPNLQELDLSNNNLTGTLPSNLKKLSQLKILDLQNNSFSGPLPTLGNLGLLQDIYINDNKFDSIPSDFFHGLTDLNTFNISNNPNLKPWFLPDDPKQSTKVQTFHAHNASITGSLPEIFSNFFNLQDLTLSHNNLSGKLDVVSSMNQLEDVQLQGNAFTGAIPDLSKCIRLKNLQLNNNRLTGLVPYLTFPFSLIDITLQNNRLQGPLPAEDEYPVNSLAINTNRFCKTTPGPCDPQVTTLLKVAGALGYPFSLAESWRGNDACAGWKYVNCDSFGKNVTTVNFGMQKFSGTISPSFANLTSLRRLMLNENNLSGKIPEGLTNLRNLIFLNVSNNNLSKPIPEFAHTVIFLHKNNPLLDKHHTPVSDGIKIGSVISVLVFVGVVLFVCYKYSKVASKLKIQITGDHSEMLKSEGDKVMISIQLLEQVTDHFSDKNILGRGGFGVVYKGELPNGTKIAVKRMKSDEKGTNGIKEFQAEIEVLTKVRHRHLVALLGYCINDHDRLLVYEYMPQGTLSQHLFEWREHESQPLSWKQRVSIALDVGRGVEYLHTLAQQSFIHRDLKPANILLDDDMRAKVADFGLVKHAPDGKHSLETRLAGTFGYLAPEYAATGRVTTKVDVFAFGVVLMQLITGLKALDKTMPDERYQLVTWFRNVPVSKETMVKFIDQDLDTDDGETLESILKVAELAHQCTANQPYERPDMGYVVNVLGPLIEQWKPSQRAQEKTYHRHHTSLPEILQSDEDTSSLFIFVRSTSF